MSTTRSLGLARGLHTKIGASLATSFDEYDRSDAKQYLGLLGQTLDEISIKRLPALEAELRNAWRESGACANFNEPVGAPNGSCVACGKLEIYHQLLRWAERLERYA